MARINLLTIHYGESYGAVLQTYATVRLLTDRGHNVNVINIDHPRNKRWWFRLSSLKFIFKKLYFYKFKCKYFGNITRKCYSIDDIRLPDADMTVVGSDQVWNRDITGEFGMTYFLYFVPETQKKIALCSSFGKSEWKEDSLYTNSVKQCLAKFDAISVREDSGRLILENTFGLKSTCLIDPTLACGRFRQMTKKINLEKVIFPFLLNPGAVTDEILRDVSHSFGYRVYQRNRMDIYLRNSVERWLSCIRNSECIITDSFHGVAMSIIFKKEFIVLNGNSAKFTRIASLLSLLGLSDRYVLSLEDFRSRRESLKEPINYDKVDEILNVERRKVSVYLDKCFKPNE